MSPESADRAQPTTPVVGRFVEVDDTRTYLVFGAFTRTMVGAALGKVPRPLVLADLTGKWNHGAEDELVLMMSPATARDWAAVLAEAAGAAEDDVSAYLAGRRPDVPGPPEQRPHR